MVKGSRVGRLVKTNTKNMKQVIDMKRFIDVWQTSNTVSEVTSKLGITAVQASAKAANMRKRGFKMKPMARTAKDYTELKSYAESLLSPPEDTSEETTTPAPAPTSAPASKKKRK